MATCPDKLGRSIENGIVSYTRDLTDEGEYVEGTTVEVSCDEGYRSSGNITCQNDGTWSSSSLPNCTSEIVDQYNVVYQSKARQMELKADN